MTVNDERFQPQFMLSGQRGINSNNLNQYTSVTGKALTYDGNGNLSYDGVFTFTHDALNRLVSAQRQEATNSYQYGPLGRRTSKTASSNTTNYIYSGDHAAVEYDQSGRLVRKFIYGPGIDEPLVMITPGQSPNTETKHYYHADVLGSVVGLTNSTGSWAETYSYSPWGELNGYSSVGNPYFYTGRRYDAETGLYYYRARYYDAYLKRFIQPDPIGFEGGMNWYAYVHNSPVNFIDPWGLEQWNVINSTSSLHYGWKMPSSKGYVGGVGDFLGNYQKMREANTIGADKYFHCMANCQASRRGVGGKDAAETISDAREWVDENFKGDPKYACDADRAANQQGREGDICKSCKDVCESLRPPGLDPKY